MTPDAFKSTVQGAYVKAIRDRNSWAHYTDEGHRIFDGVAVFGREAGVDLIETLIDAIRREAVQAAGAKRNALTLRPGRVGRAALAGMVETLRALTGLQVTEANGTITLAWAKSEPDLI